MPTIWRRALILLFLISALLFSLVLRAVGVPGVAGPILAVPFCAHGAA